MSTIKVDTIATRTGSGNITVSNNIAGAGTISGTIITATASGAPLIVNSTNGNDNKIIFQDAGSAVSHLGGISNGLVFANAAGTQIGRLDADGIKFGTDTAAANGLGDYETGSWTPGLKTTNGTALSSPTSTHGKYLKIGDLLYISFYYYKTGVTSSGSDPWIITGLPFTTLLGAAGAYQFIACGYNYTGADRTGNGMHRWQTYSGDGTTLRLHGPNMATNVSNQAVEFNGAGTIRLA